MRAQSNVIAGNAVTGTALGALGVLAFSLSLPATRAAVADLDPWFTAFGRAVGAGLLALVYLGIRRASRPTKEQWRRLTVVALGVVAGFPLFTSLALTVQPAAHGAIVVALLPGITAVFAVLRGRERPPVLFWAAAGVGVLTVLGFTALRTTPAGTGSSWADLSLFAAVLLCGLGYAEGGVLARTMGGAVTICWALILALPLTTAATVAAMLHRPPVDATPQAWLGFGYLTVVSMFLGFVAWYAGLARGGIARVGQVQLAQPLLTLLWSALLLGEHVTWHAAAVAVAVLACVAATQRAKSTGAAVPPETDPAPALTSR
ncbi:DMT family transporter [Actinoplanes rectilineatus]|uniref:DMT family transporter n=1 Tax=Actinoplanes rectilineatus TaxID=113571 RepID=UPI0005F299F3|nr:DMT family transporter [Actinoplanes rectilineatus]